MSRGVPLKKKTYALQNLLITVIFDIFPRAMKRLSNNPAETARMVRDMVILAPERRMGIQDRTC
jgi:hypothetical protein